MSDDKKKVQDEKLDDVSGGIGAHPVPPMPVRPGGPPTHPGPGVPTPIKPGPEPG